MNMTVMRKPNEGFEYYRGEIYWNNFDAIKQRINTLISGDGSRGWQQHLGQHHGRFERAFFPSCGNGWVEREMFQAGLIRQAEGSDVGVAMLQQARQLAQEMGLPAEYREGDINGMTLPEDRYDLVVNHAAMHHVAYINRVTCQLARSLKVSGLYVAFDYVGPHRNQYPWASWSAMVEMRLCRSASGQS